MTTNLTPDDLRDLSWLNTKKHVGINAGWIESDYDNNYRFFLNGWNFKLDYIERKSAKHDGKGLPEVLFNIILNNGEYHENVSPLGFVWNDAIRENCVKFFGVSSVGGVYINDNQALSYAWNEFQKTEDTHNWLVKDNKDFYTLFLTGWDSATTV